MRAWLGAALLILFLPASAHAHDAPTAAARAASAARVQDPLAIEMRRRNDALVHEGFNFGMSTTVSVAGTRVEFVVPPPEGESHQVALWFAAATGTLAVRMVGPGGEVVASWRGRVGEQRLERVLAPGSYVVEASGAAGRGLVGIKGDVVGRCPLDPARVSERPADPRQGFHWPYLLVRSKAEPTGLLVLPNSSGFLGEDLALLRASASCEVATELAMADRLGVAVLVPLFPRPAVAGEQENLYLHALTRAALATRVPAWTRVDLQLEAMIDDARAQLGGRLGPRVLMTGFSAAGSFVNRFAVLHPRRVLAAAIGSPGGWPIAPAADATLTYPVGVADLQALVGAPADLPALRDVPLFFYMGGDDDNDAVPHRDSFSAADEALVLRRFGPTPVARWAAAERLYKQAGLHATFRLYPGVAHMTAPAMRIDIEAHLRAALTTRAADDTRR